MKRYISRLFMVIIFCVLGVGAAQSQIIDLETFGNGPFPGAELPAGQITYDYNPVAIQPANFPDILNDGEYVLATDPQQGFTNWSSIGDNTTGTGYMLLVNVDDDLTGEFYRRRVTLTPNTAFDFLAYAVNVNSQIDFDFCTGPGNDNGELALANITLQIEAPDGTILASQDTGDIPFNPVPVWEEYGLTFATDASTSDIDIVLINNSLGGCGNDLAIDDITFRVAVTIEASDDSLTVTDTATQQNDILFVGTNDTLNDNPLPGSELYFIEPPTVLPPELLFDTDTGAVSVLAGTPSGTYSFEYRVCETANEFNCDTSMVTITVDLPPVDIVVQNDSGSVFDSSLGNSSVLNVLGNDTIDGAAPTNFDLSLAAGETLPAGLTFDTDTGEVVVLQGTPTSTLSFDYLLCEAGDPDNCESASVTINVTNPNPPSVCPVGTSPVTGTFHAVSAVSNTQFQNLVSPNNALDAPLANGQTATNGNSGRTFNADVLYDLTGDPNIIVPEGTVIHVANANFFGNNPTIGVSTSLDNSNFTSVGSTTGLTGNNIIRQDSYTVPSGGAQYLLLQRSNNSAFRFDGLVYDTQCMQGPAVPPIEVVAVNDSGSVTDTSLGDTVVLNVLDNDSIDGVTLPTAFDLSLASASLPAGLTFDTATGAVTVLQGTPTGTLSFDYTLCEAGNDLNCETVTVTIDVTNPNPPSICPFGTIPITGTFHVTAATSATPNQTLTAGNNVLDAPVSEGDTATNSNSGQTFNADVLYDLTGDPDILVPEGTDITVALASFFGTNPTVPVLMSIDGVTALNANQSSIDISQFTSVGSSPGLNPNVQNQVRHDVFTVPSGGARYVLLQRDANFRFDGVIYDTQCIEGAPEPDPAPNLSAAKTVAMFNPAEYALPGNDVVYTITVTNDGDGIVDNNTLELIDIMPAEVAFYNMDADPVVFVDNGSGLTFDAANDVAFSNATTAPADFEACNYTPTANDYDEAVTFICFNPKGEMNPTSSWNLSFRARID